MNDDYDDDLLFGFDDIERYKRGEQPEGWFEAQKNILVARCHAQNRWDWMDERLMSQPTSGSG